MAIEGYDNIKIQDVAEVFLILPNGDKKYYGCTTNTGLNKTVDKELLRCGIGNQVSGVLWTQQDYQVTVEPLYYQASFMEVQSGTDFTQETFIAPKVEKEEAVDNAGSIEVTIDGTPVNDEVTVTDAQGNTYTATFATGTVTITDGVEGDTYYILYDEEEISAEVLDFDADKFPKNVHLQLHTVAYIPKTDAKVADLYWDFPIASPDGALDVALSTGTNSQNSVTFDILSEKDSYGSHAIVPVV